MEVAGSAVGIASLGIQICQGLLSYYGAYKDYHRDVQSIYDSILNLNKTFESLRDLYNHPVVKEKELGQVDACLRSCVQGVDRLKRKLSKVKSTKVPIGPGQKAWAETQRLFYPLRASSLAKLKEIVEELVGNLSLAVQILQLDLGAGAHDKLGALQHGVHAITSQSKALQNEVCEWKQDDNHRKLVKWLSAPDPWKNHDAARNRHEPNTGAWLLNAHAYKQWKDSQNSVLWLNGKAGCGKTILCYGVTEDIRKQCADSQDGRLAFFYFTFAEKEKQSCSGLLSSLVCQLCKDAASTDRLQLEHKRLFPRTPPNELLEEILLLSLQQPGQVTLALDALDELPDDDYEKTAVVALLERITKASGRLRIFVTSRQIPHLERDLIASLGAVPLSSNTEMVNADIRIYVGNELSRHQKLQKLDDSTKIRIQEILELKADGMFRWAYCQLEELKKLKSTRPLYINRKLQDLPTGLDATYERLLSDIEEVYRHEAITALRWLSFGLRPLTLCELNEAFLISPEGEGHIDMHNRADLGDVLEILAGLVSVESSSRHASRASSRSPDHLADTAALPVTAHSKVRLAHYSVKEYLVSTRISKSSTVSIFHLGEDLSHHYIAQCCIIYMIHYSDHFSTQSPQMVQLTLPLLRYAAQAWYTHLHRGMHDMPGREIGLLTSERYRRDWIAIHDPAKYLKLPWTDHACGSALYYACLLGLRAAADHMIADKPQSKADAVTWDSPLHAAAQNGHTAIVELLLKNGSDIDCNGGSLESTALFCASHFGHTDVAKLLLKNGADVNASGNWGTSLQVASDMGYRETVELLLSNGADVDATSKHDGSTALIAASRMGQDEIVEILLRRGANITTRAHHGTALSSAAKFEHERTVELLLNNGADPVVRSEFVNALEDGLAKDARKAVSLLLDKGAHISLLPEYVDLALRLESARNQEEVVKLLAPGSADTNAA